MKWFNIDLSEMICLSSRPTCKMQNELGGEVYYWFFFYNLNPVPVAYDFSMYFLPS